MPDKRHHRGEASADAAAFAPAQWPRLRTAVADLAWLLTRGYAEDSALKLVGDRHDLTARQRLAVRRCAAADQACDQRRQRELGAADLRGRELWLDGFNILLTLEVALSGGVLLLGRDGCIRDMAGVHGSYRKVEETQPALEQIGMALASLEVQSAVWYLDRPVSNSGRLKQWIAETAARHGWPWQVEVVFNPDRELIMGAGAVIATADSMVLDHGGNWFNLVRHVLAANPPVRPLLDLTGD
jgi:hypothetical protein